MIEPISEIWLEFEEWTKSPSEQRRNFFNMKIRLRDGREYALNVWTLEYIQEVQDELREEQSLFTLGPDIIVEVADRQTLEDVADRLVEGELLREDWRVRS